MNDRMPQVTAREIVRALKRDGWIERAQKGSHLHFTHVTKPGRVTVPIHRGDMKMGTLRGIISQAGLTEKEFRDLL